MNDAEFCKYISKLHEELLGGSGGGKNTVEPVGYSNGVWVFVKTKVKAKETTEKLPTLPTQHEDQARPIPIGLPPSNERDVAVAMGGGGGLGAEFVKNKVKSVTPGASLSDAGITRGCIIKAINGVLTPFKRDINKMVSSAEGDILTMTVVYPETSAGRASVGNKRKARNVLETMVPEVKANVPIFHRSTDAKIVEMIHRQQAGEIKKKAVAAAAAAVAAERKESGHTIDVCTVEGVSPKKHRGEDVGKKLKAPKLVKEALDDFNDDELLDDCFSDKVSVAESIAAEHKLDGVPKTLVTKMVNDLGDHHPEVRHMWENPPKSLTDLTPHQATTLLRVYSSNKRIRSSFRKVFPHLFLNPTTTPLLKDLTDNIGSDQMQTLLTAPNENKVQKSLLQPFMMVYVNNPEYQGAIRHVFPKLFASKKLDLFATKMLKVNVTKAKRN